MPSVSSASERVDEVQLSVNAVDNINDLDIVPQLKILAQSPAPLNTTVTAAESETQKIMRERVAVWHRRVEKVKREAAEKRERIHAQLEKLDSTQSGINKVSSVAKEDSANPQSSIHHDKYASNHKDTPSPVLNDLIKHDGKKDKRIRRSQQLPANDLTVTQSMAACNAIAQDSPAAIVPKSLEPRVMALALAPLPYGCMTDVGDIEAVEQASTVVSKVEADEKDLLIDLDCPALLLKSILKSTYQNIQHRLLLVLPATNHSLSIAANEFLIACVVRAVAGCWLLTDRILSDAKVVKYFTEDWAWSPIFATAFSEKFAELQQPGGPHGSYQEDNTKEFVEEHWGWDTVVALCAEGAG
ncbi:hypothetical protein MMC18_009605 [Xylographa bjoerkii]|nr:hypothetical protein [Xylographa bjoerkii]